MFSGRYIWWLLTSTTLFLVVVAGFDFVAGIGVTISNCAMREGSCYSLYLWLMSSVKPIPVVLAAMPLVLVVLIRILYLRFQPLWVLAVLVWVAVTGGALAAYEPLWHEGANYSDLLQLLPPSTFAFIALALFLAFPLEDEDVPQAGGAAPIGLLAGFTAFMCMLHAFATSSNIALHIDQLFGTPSIAQQVENVRALLAVGLLVADGNPIPGYFMVIMFALALALRILRHERLVSGDL